MRTVHGFGSVVSNRLLLTVLLASLLLVFRDSSGRRSRPWQPEQTGWVRLAVEGAGVRLVPLPQGEDPAEFAFARIAGERSRLSGNCLGLALEPCSEVRIASEESGREAECLVIPLAERCRYLHGLPMDLNRADTTDFDLLPGVGARLSERIVRERERRGKYTSVDELASISGFGARLLRKIGERLTAGE